MSAEFCDTNIIVYAYDVSAGHKRDQAQRLLERLWMSGDGVLSVQVLQELFVSLTRKLPARIPSSDARAIVSHFGTWQVVEPTRREVLEAIDASVRWKLAFWDAMILVAAQKAGAGVLWSEDLNDRQAFDGTVVSNPFRQ